MSVRKRPDQRRGKAGTTRDLGVVVRRSFAEVPELPAKLNGLKPLPETVEAWGRLWASSVAQVMDPTSDREALVRWASLLDERERAFRAYRRKRLVEGSQGQPVVNPLWGVVAKCDAELRALEDRIGLSPKARLQLGITFAEAATSLDELNAFMDGEDANEPVADPRLGVIEADAS